MRPRGGPVTADAPKCCIKGCDHPQSRAGGGANSASARGTTSACAAGFVSRPRSAGIERERRKASRSSRCHSGTTTTPMLW